MASCSAAATVAATGRRTVQHRTALQQCCSVGVQPQHHARTFCSTSQAGARQKPAKSAGRKDTPPGTNAKPAAAGRPKRYKTTYGIPALHPSLLASIRGEGSLNRNERERAQWPDYAKIWQLEDKVQQARSGKGNSKDLEKNQSALLELRRDQPKRHPLWAFFHEKSQEELEGELRNRSEKSEDIATAAPGTYSLASALEAPNKSAGTSGRSWKAEELRRKSFEDLHTLWFKLVIERNILATQKDEAKRNNVPWTEFTYISEQMHRCRKSMARIKYVLAERRKAALEAKEILRRDAQRTREGSVDPVGVPPARNSLFEEARPSSPASLAPSS